MASSGLKKMLILTILYTYKGVSEHLKAPSPIFDHLNITGHNVTIDNFSIVGREDQNLIRTIKEALYIRVNNHPWIRTNTTSHIYGMRLCLTPQNSNWSNIDPSGYSIWHLALPSAIIIPTLHWLFHLPHWQ